MAFYLKEVAVDNFRSIRSGRFPLEPYTPLIGYNNAGKTNVVDAIQWLLRKTSLSRTDYYDGTNGVVVSGRIEGISAGDIAVLAEPHRTKLQPFVLNGNLSIRRTQSTPGASISNVKLEVLEPGTGTWTLNPSGIDNAIAALFPEPIRVGAMQNAEEDAAKAKASTTIGKLLKEFSGQVIAAHGPELNNFLSQLESRLAADGATRFAELVALEGAINTKIGEMFPEIGARLHFPVPAMEDLITSGTLKLSESAGPHRDFGSYGHGTQRSVQMVLIRHLADIQRNAGHSNRTTLLLIDEPELYLHPFAIEQIRVALKALSTHGYQVIFTTHCAQFVPSTDAHNSLLIRKDANSGTHPRPRLIDAIRRAVPDAQHQTEQLFSLTNASQILFAERVILTEGKTELRLLPCLHEAIRNKSLGLERCALIAQSGSGDTRKSMNVLAAMNIPAKAIVDLDYGCTAAINQGLVSPSDADIVALKGVFQRLSTAGAITLNPSGFPRNGSGVTAEEAYEILANEADATTPIDNLHAKLLTHGIWMWKRGAIEAHLGLSAKTETEWARFHAAILANGVPATCRDHVSIASLLAWLYT